MVTEHRLSVERPSTPSHSHLRYLTEAQSTSGAPLPSFAFKDHFEMQEAAIFPALGPLLAGAGRVAMPILRVQGVQLLRGAQAFFRQAWRGVATKVAELSKSAWNAIASKAYWLRFAKIGGTSAAIRGTYDLATGTELKAMQRNAALAFLGGGVCGGLIPRIPLSASPFVNQWVSPVLRRAIPYNYVGLDILGDSSKNYLVDIREKHGDRKGIAMAGALLAAENGMATLAFLPFVGTWGKAAKTALTATAISVGMETYLQHNSGKELRDVDPGRFVGMSAWGHSIVVLPEAILGGAAKAVGLAQAFGRATELGVKYIVFVNPSVNNFSAQINNQNWENVQMGNTARHASAMWFARLVQSTIGPSHPLAMLVDEGMGTATIAFFNEVWPFYEGVPEIWSQGFFNRVRASETKAEYESLTQYLSEEMGALSLTERTYLPSPINLEQAKRMMTNTPDPMIRDRFAQYLRHLDGKGETRTPQEQKIFEHFSNAPQVAWVF